MRPAAHLMNVVMPARSDAAARTLMSFGRFRIEQINEMLVRIDVHAAPASVIKQLGDAIDHRIVRTHVDVETALDVAQRPVQQDVFKVLRIRNDHSTLTCSLLNPAPGFLKSHRIATSLTPAPIGG
ncbi:Uncharacterised protein [Afipia felis]|uniref:Uncharacterized protein n=2 Tax=Afipia felis TaxID=1035 RepID=A0A381AYR4_AFIFE|nr:Uncharacterised protein [Afipia felis]